MEHGSRGATVRQREPVENGRKRRRRFGSVRNPPFPPDVNQPPVFCGSPRTITPYTALNEENTVNEFRQRGLRSSRKMFVQNALRRKNSVRVCAPWTVLSTPYSVLPSRSSPPLPSCPHSLPHDVFVVQPLLSGRTNWFR